VGTIVNDERLVCEDLNQRCGFGRILALPISASNEFG
jgi:hypothetical protein